MHIIGCQLYLLQGLPDRAIAQFQVILKQYPNDKKVPDTMVQDGLAYYAKGDLTQAQTILNKVQHKYPNTPAAKLARERLQQIQQSSQMVGDSSNTTNN